MFTFVFPELSWRLLFSCIHIHTKSAFVYWVFFFLCKWKCIFFLLVFLTIGLQRRLSTGGHRSTTFFLTVPQYSFIYSLIYRYLGFSLCCCCKHYCSKKNHHTYFFHIENMQRYVHFKSYLSTIKSFSKWGASVIVYEGTHFCPFLPTRNIAFVVASLHWSSPPGFRVFVLSLPH